MERLGADPAETLMVGDTDYDLRMARAAGAGSVAVAWGAHDVRRLAGHGALACLESLLSLPDWLEDFEADLAQHG
jgi:phosphoglycolate phosphatase